MRLSLIAPADLTDHDMHAGFGKGVRGFTTEREDGALMGAWNSWLHEPAIGRAVWDLTKSLSADSTLPPPCRQIAILVTGAHFRASYEIHAHVAVAQRQAPGCTIATIVAGQQPADLPADQAIAYASTFPCRNALTRTEARRATAWQDPQLCASSG